MKKLGIVIIKAFALVYNLITLVIGFVLALIITPFKIANRMSEDMQKKIW